MANFITEIPQKPSQLVDSLKKKWWMLHVDGTYRVSGFGIGLLLQSPIREQIEQTIRLGFLASNNEAEHEAILAILYLALTPIDDYIGDMQQFPTDRQTDLGRI